MLPYCHSAAYAPGLLIMGLDIFIADGLLSLGITHIILKSHDNELILPHGHKPE